MKRIMRDFSYCVSYVTVIVNDYSRSCRKAWAAFSCLACIALTVFCPVLYAENKKEVGNMAYRICIDAGHGGTDPGAVNGKYHESNATLAIAKKVGAKLTAKGCVVKYTRTKDKAVSLAQRCKVSNEFKADAFVSIHLNAATNKDASGIETWRYTKVGSKTKKLAENVQTELISALGWKDRGVKTSSAFYVLKHTAASAILIEAGFISNDKECKKLFSNSYQNKIATAIANGVMNTLK